MVDGKKKKTAERKRLDLSEEGRKKDNNETHSLLESARSFLQGERRETRKQRWQQDDPQSLIKTI